MKKIALSLALMATLSAPATASVVSTQMNFTYIDTVYSEQRDSSASPDGWTSYFTGVVNGMEFDKSTYPLPMTVFLPQGGWLDLASEPVLHHMALNTDALAFQINQGWIYSQSNFWYAPYPEAVYDVNTISFLPNTADVEKNEVFQLGTLRVQNGNWFAAAGGGTGITEIGFTITTSSTDSEFDGHTFSGALMYETMMGLAPDQYWIKDHLEYGVFTVEDYPNTNVGTIDLNGYIASLHVTDFSNPTGGAVLVSSVPEPETYSMILAGLGLVCVAARRRRG